VLNTGRRFDAQEIWDLVERENVFVISLVGDAMARPLVDAIANRDHVPTVLAIVSGGAILSPSIKAEINETLPNAMVIDAFGASETGANGAVDMTDKGPRFRMNESTTVITEAGKPAPVGELGLLARRGHVPVGYYKDAEKTAATFVEFDGVRWAIPGDRAVVEEDGTITVLGRGSQCINTGGEKVFPEEVEAVLKSHPDVFDAIVVGIPDARFGEAVAAVVAPRPGRTPTLDELAGYARTALAGYKIPKRLVLVDEVARTPAGKPNYRWAKALANAN
jgi:acyl-CoA synthetase (AMP-forming)/AMP-acid ligase II